MEVSFQSRLLMVERDWSYLHVEESEQMATQEACVT